MESAQIRDWTHVSCIGRWILYHWAIREAPMECLLPSLMYGTDIAWPAIKYQDFDWLRYSTYLYKSRGEKTSFPYVYQVDAIQEAFPSFHLWCDLTVNGKISLPVPEGHSSQHPKQAGCPGIHRKTRWLRYLNKRWGKMPGNQRNVSRDGELGGAVSRVCVARFHLFNLEVSKDVFEH